jgi:DNA polymerase elongation subunit (family B)
MTVFAYKNLKKIIKNRIEYINQSDRKTLDDRIANKEPLEFLPTYLMETHMQDVKYGKAYYKIVLMGILSDGRKVNVILDKIEPYFDVRIPDDTSELHSKQSDIITEILESLKNSENIDPVKRTIYKAKPFKYYQENKSTYLRLYYTKLKNRVEAIKYIHSLGYETACDDLSNYYRVVCRDFQTSFSTWTVLSNYKYETNSFLKGETFRLPIGDFKKYEDASENKMEKLNRPIPDHLKKDKTLTMTWDIETFSLDEKTEIASPEIPTDCITTLGMTFQWVHEKEPFLKICLCDYPANARDDYITIICGNETNIILGFGEVFAKLRPEFIEGFNDSDFDWNWVIKRASQTKGLLSKLAECFDSTVPYQNYTDANVLRFNYRKEKNKVEAGTYIDGYSLMLPGYIPIDVRTIFRKLYPTSEKSSLKWFLEKNKLGGKEDMPYQEMFAIYRKYRLFMEKHNFKNTGDKVELDPEIINSLSPEELSEYDQLKLDTERVNYYCVVDALRCHDLIRQRYVVTDAREVSVLPYVSVYDSFYRANGMKVVNLTIGIGQKAPFNLRFSNISNTEFEDGKYPGAYVFPPKKGLKISKLSIEERIKKAELYKSKKSKSLVDNPYHQWLDTNISDIDKVKDIISKHGAVIAEDKIKVIEEELSFADIKFSNGSSIIPKKFKEFLKENIGRPITGLDFSSLYPSLIRAYNFSPEYCILDKSYAKKVAASGKIINKAEFEYNGRRRVGYFVWHNNKYDKNDPEFQFGIFPYILNDLFNQRKKLKKQMHVFAHRKEQIEAMPNEEQKTLTAEYEDVLFNLAYLNCKQNALKVFMNTFYGCCGSKVSPFFVLEIAGGITAMGQQNIKFAHAFVTEKACDVKYGDSLAANTPVIVKLFDGSVGMYEVKNLCDDIEFKQDNHSKETSIPDEMSIWSDNGWQKIKRLIRHKTDKKMYRVLTHTGLIDVTEDHSLLDPSGAMVKPEELKVGDTLLHKSLPQIQNLDTSDYVKIKTFKVKTQLEAAKLYWKIHSCGYTAIIDNKLDEYIIKLVSRRRKFYNKIKKIIPLPKTEDYVYDFETENHHFSAGVGELVAHNTDSLYISTPEVDFQESDKLFYTGKINKLDYWTRMVEITMKAIEAIKLGVNAAFLADNGTEFLAMDYEEVLFPVGFMAKKKYVGIAHVSIANFSPKELFIRGLDLKKRGISEILKKICMEILWTCMSPENLYDLIELVLDKIDEIYIRKWNHKDFIQTGIYKPTKNNVKIKRFVERMRERGIVVKPNERFNYVICKKYPFTYDLRGRKKPISVGDKLELDTNTEAEIDLDYYMQGSINGQLARLITYHEMFHVEAENNTVDDIATAEKKIYNNACKFIENYCSKYYAKYNTFGKTYQKIFKKVSGIVGETVKKTDSLASVILSANVDYADFESWFVNIFTEKAAEKLVMNYGEAFVESELKNVKLDEICGSTRSDKEINKAMRNKIKDRIKTLQKIYYGNKKNSILPIREERYKETINILRSKIREKYDALMKVYRVYNKGVANIVDMVKNKLQISDNLYQPASQKSDFKLEDFENNESEITNNLDEEMTELAKENTEKLFADDSIKNILFELKNLYNNMLAAHLYIKRTHSIVDYLKTKRDDENFMITRPSKEHISKSIKSGFEKDKSMLMSMKL